MKVYREDVEFFGHAMVRSEHYNTIEVTRDPNLTSRGDCIIGVRADKGPSDLSGDVRESIMTDGSSVVITIEVQDERFVVTAAGSSKLSLSDSHEMVVRKSGFTSPRTLAIGADAAAKDIPRAMVEKLRSPDRLGLLRIEVSI